MKRIITIIGVLAAVMSIRADAYRDSLYALTLCEKNTMPVQLLDNVDKTDSLSLLQNEFMQSEMFQEYVVRAFEPFARNHISGQSLYMLLRHCQEQDEKQKAALEKDNAFIVAQEQYNRAVEDLQQRNRNITNVIIAGGYVAFLKRYYPLQAARLNDRMASPDTTRATPEVTAVADAPEDNERQPQKPRWISKRWKVGDEIYYQASPESVPSPDKEDYLWIIHLSGSSFASYVGVVKRVQDNGHVNVNIYEKKGSARGRLVATRNYTDTTQVLIGRQVDYYPSGKPKRVCIYNKDQNVISVTETDTLGNIVKTIEGRGANRKEKQYYNNGQLRKEKLGAGPKYTIHCFDKKGNPVNYLEGDLYAFDDGVYVIAGNPPSYPGGIKAASEYASSHVYIPESIRGKRGLYSTQCSVKIADDGSVMDDVRIVSGSGSPEFDAEAVAVLKEMPKWSPGKLKKWKFVQNPKNAKITIIRRRYIITVSVII